MAKLDYTTGNFGGNNMNIGELKKLIADLDDALVVILQCDGEGNSYSFVEGIDADNIAYDDENELRVGPIKLSKELINRHFSEEDLIDGPACAVIW